MSRGDLLSKIGRDIVFLWVLSFALLSFHAITKRAHYDRIVVSGSFNAISIARALAVVPEGNELTVDRLYHWYQEATFGNLSGREAPMPDSLNLGPLDLSYLVNIRPFGISNSCSILVRVESINPDTNYTVTIHPSFDCLFNHLYSVFPTRLSVAINEGGQGILDHVFFSSIWIKPFDERLVKFSNSGHCDVQGFCLDGQYGPVDFQITPQPYFDDQRVNREFRLNATQIMPPEAFERVNVEPTAQQSEIEPFTSEEYSEIFRRAQSEFRRIDGRSDGAFLQQSVPSVVVPFLGILISAFLVCTTLSRSLRLYGPLIGDAEGHVLGPCPAWNLPQLIVKLLMALTPIAGVAVAGMVFQDIFRLSLVSGIFINPLDGVFIQFSPTVETDRPIVSHAFPWMAFPTILAIWLLSLASAVASSVLLTQRIFSMKLEETLGQ